MHPAIRYRRRLSLLALLLALVTALSGCGVGKSLATRTTAAPILPPTAPPRPTATPLATAASTLGWVIYHNPRYPFQVPVPPQWQVATLTGSTPATSCTSYDVNVFPPGDKPVLSEPVAEFNQEVIYISFERNCPPVDPASWAPPASSITINGINTTLYGPAHPDGGDIQRLAVITLGGSECHFYMQSPATTAKRDLSVFLGMLNGFEYTSQ